MSILLDPDNQKIIKKYHNNFIYYVNNYEFLNEHHQGEFIAIDNDHIMDKDPEQQVLLDRLTKKFGDIRHVFIKYVNKKDYQSMI